jgi:hypothetical protein
MARLFWAQREIRRPSVQDRNVEMGMCSWSYRDRGPGMNWPTAYRNPLEAAFWSCTSSQAVVSGHKAF